jgi:uncharacterized protein DUF4236
MGWRLYRRFHLMPGLRINLSRSGLSLSLGHRGFWYTVGARGKRATLGLPGSGIFYTKLTPWVRRKYNMGNVVGTEFDIPQRRHRAFFLLFLLVVFFVVLRLFSH